MENKLYPKVYMWLFIGLLITGLTGMLVIYSNTLISLIFNNIGYILIFILQIIIAIYLGSRITKMNPTTAKILYILYAILTGLTFSSIFLIFEIESIMIIFIITAILFLIFAFIGKTTNLDLSKISTFLIIGLITIIIVEIVNIFLMNNTLDIILSIISIIIFLGYIAYDMQKIKKLSNYGYTDDNIAIIGAFELYLDFVNIFIELLRLFGRERN